MLLQWNKVSLKDSFKLASNTQTALYTDTVTFTWLVAPVLADCDYFNTAISDFMFIKSSNNLNSLCRSSVSSAEDLLVLQRATDFMDFILHTISLCRNLLLSTFMDSFDSFCCVPHSCHNSFRIYLTVKADQLLP